MGPKRGPGRPLTATTRKTAATRKVGSSKKRSTQPRTDETYSPPRTRSRAAKPSATVQAQVEQPQEQSKPRGRPRLSRGPQAPAKASEGKASARGGRQRKLPRATQQSRRERPSPPEASKSRRVRQQETVSESSSSRDLLHSYLDQTLEEDLLSFKQEARSTTRELLADIEKISGTNFDLRALGRQVEALLQQVRDRGYEPSDPDLIIMAKKQKKEPAQIAEDARTEAVSGISTGITFNKRKFDEKNKILARSRISIKPEVFIDEDPSTSLAHGLNAIPASQPIEAEWKHDLDKCLVGNEALFQRTIMMTSLDRHRLLGVNKNLDYNVELDWYSDHPLGREDLGELRENILLPAPRPDVCIGFRPEALLSYKGERSEMWLLPEALRRHMLPEKLADARDDGRAFPFLMLEVKGSGSSVGGQDANYQAANNAAHALYNMWMFVKDDRALRQRYLHNVRVFTAGGHGEKFWMYRHRAVELSLREGRFSDEYPIGFRYEKLVEITGSMYTQENVQTLLRNVMDQAIDELMPLLQDAIEFVCNRAIEARNTSSLAPAATAGQSVLHAGAGAQDPNNNVEQQAFEEPRSESRYEQNQGHASSKKAKRRTQVDNRTANSQNTSEGSVAGGFEQGSERPGPASASKRRRTSGTNPRQPNTSFTSSTGNTQTMQQAQIGGR